MQITSCEFTNTKYIQIYLTEEELQKQETKEIIKKYKNYEKCGIILKNPFNKLLYINKYDEIRRKI